MQRSSDESSDDDREQALTYEEMKALKKLLKRCAIDPSGKVKCAKSDKEQAATGTRKKSARLEGNKKTVPEEESTEESNVDDYAMQLEKRKQRFINQDREKRKKEIAEEELMKEVMKRRNKVERQKLRKIREKWQEADRRKNNAISEEYKRELQERAEALRPEAEWQRAKERAAERERKDKENRDILRIKAEEYKKKYNKELELQEAREEEQERVRYLTQAFEEMKEELREEVRKQRELQKQYEEREMQREQELEEERERIKSRERRQVRDSIRQRELEAEREKAAKELIGKASSAEDSSASVHERSDRRKMTGATNNKSEPENKKAEIDQYFKESRQRQREAYRVKMIKTGQWRARTPEEYLLYMETREPNIANQPYEEIIRRFNEYLRRNRDGAL